MGNIPLPALAIRPPEIESYDQMQGAALGRRLGQADLQGKNLQNKQMQAVLLGNQAIVAAQHDSDFDANDPDSVIRTFKKYNVPLQLQGQAMKAIGDMKEALQSQSKADLAEAAEAHSFFDDQFQGAKSAPLENREKTYQQAVAHARSFASRLPNGPAKQQAIAEVSAFPPMYDENWINSQHGLLKTQSALVEEALKKSQTAEAEAKGAQANAESNLFGAELPGKQAASTMQQQEANLTPQDRAQLKTYGEAGVMEMRDWLGKNPGRGPADFLKWKTALSPQINFSLQNQGAVGGPGGKPSSIAQSLADGSMKWQDAVSARTPMQVKQQLLAEVKSIKPDFRTMDYDLDKKVEQKFTSGNVSDQLMAIGTAREHMKTFSSLADALGNDDVKILNQLGNKIGVQFGDDSATNFKIAQQAFGGEVGKALDGAGVTQAERASAENAFNSAMSPKQFKGAVRTVDELLAGKQKAAKDAYGNARSGRPNFGQGNAATSDSDNDPFAKFGGKSRQQ